MKCSMKMPCKQLRGNESGDSLVEFAICSSIFFMVLFGIIGCSLAVYADHYVSSVASDAARYAMVRGSTWNGAPCASPSSYACTAKDTDVSNYVISFISGGLNARNLTVMTTWPGTAPAGSCNTIDGTHSPGCVVNVQVSYSFNYPVPFLAEQPLVFTSTAVAVIAQ